MDKRTDGRTDGRHDDANSRSFCVAVRSSKKNRGALVRNSTLILEVFPLHQIAHVWVSKHISLKLFGSEIIFEVFQPM